MSLVIACAGTTALTVSRGTTEAALFRKQLATINAALLVAGLRQHELAEATDRLNALLEVHATTDGLTGLKNHRTFQERLKEEIERTLRYNAPLSVLLLDVNNFRQHNDEFGHLTGDAILRRIGEMLNALARHTDTVARYGGRSLVSSCRKQMPMARKSSRSGSALP